MNCPFAIDNATVLDREIRGESSLYITAFSGDCGLVRMMKKISAKRTGVLPDLFDDISANGESETPTSLKFLREFSILKRRNDIALNYDSFENASQISLTTMKNGGHIEDTQTLAFRLRTALDAIAAKSPPIITRLKFMYLLVRDEGYPVREDFYANLQPAQRELFSLLIKTPSNQLGEFQTRAFSLLEKFLIWTYSNTDIIE